jgi:ribosomal protein S8
MAMNDPLGDMLTRIRNAQMRKRGKVSTPGSSLRKKVLDVLESEGYIRGYSTTDYGDGRTEFEIELKYFDDQPVIRKIERVSARRQWPRRGDCLDAERRDGRPFRPGESRRRRGPVHRLLDGPQV